MPEGSLVIRPRLAKQERQGLYEARRAEHDQQGVARQLLPGRNPRELAHDEFEVALDRSEIAARLIGLAQG